MIAESHAQHDSTDAESFTHLVEFYEDEDHVSGAVIDFLMEGRSAGEAMVLIATPARREAIREGLESRGFDLDAACLAGEAVSCDARDLLGSIMVGDEPDHDRFASSMQTILEQSSAYAAADRIRIFGELVDLLCHDGLHEGAIRLEEFWNQLARTRAFTLFCAYSMGNLYREIDGSIYRRICARHTHVVPVESSS